MKPPLGLRKTRTNQKRGLGGDRRATPGIAPKKDRHETEYGRSKWKIGVTTAIEALLDRRLECKNAATTERSGEGAIGDG